MRKTEKTEKAAKISPFTSYVTESADSFTSKKHSRIFPPNRTRFLFLFPTSPEPNRPFFPHSVLCASFVPTSVLLGTVALLPPTDVTVRCYVCFIVMTYPSPAAAAANALSPSSNQAINRPLLVVVLMMMVILVILLTGDNGERQLDCR